MYQVWNGDIVQRIIEFHEKYGDVVRVAPNELSYINAQAWNGTKSGNLSASPIAILICALVDIAGHKSPSGQGNLPKDLHNRRLEPNGTPSIVSLNH
jgi:hypothetical protein